jgi:hypothetical protein
MSIDDVSPVRPATGTTSRRKLLERIGVTGLATAAMMFGKADPAPAHSGTHYCCFLQMAVHCSMRFCATHGDYIWRCRYGSRTCSCCEDYSGCSAAVCS